MSPLNLSPFLNPAVELARQAGERLMELYGNVSPEKKEDGGAVSVADKESDELIVRGLERYFPSHVILSEERPLNGRKNQFVWVVDPLDGSKDYLDRTGQFAVHIGLLWGTQAIVGVVYVPAEKILYYGTALNGSYVERNGETKELHVSGRPIEESRLLMSRKDFKDASLVERIKRELGVREVIQAGSFGYKVGLIAEGKADAYINTKKSASVWDAFPPEIILKCAGGRVTDFDGHDLHYLKGGGPHLLRGAICSNGVSHDELVKRAQQYLVVD